MRWNWKLFWHKIWHWEYWSLETIYYPLFPVWLFYSIRARSFFFFNAANPSIKNGGMAMESKMDIYELMPEDVRPRTLLIKKDSEWHSVLDRIKDFGIGFPFIAKPDIGMKAFGVDKIDTPEELLVYLQKTPQDFLVQEFVPYTREIGVFYAKHPDWKKGVITGIVNKEFLSVTGDGISNILELIRQDPRSHLQLHKLKKEFGDQIFRIPAKNEKCVLVPFGSHTRGAKFTDETAKATAELMTLVEGICSRIPGFYYGRLDILFNSFDELNEGRNFKIIEINGAGSEATHIYDPRHSIFFAWREIIKHWDLLYQISMANKKKGHRYLSFREGTEMLRANSQLEAQLKAF